MTKIAAVADLVKHLRLDDRKPNSIVVVEMSRLSEWLSLAWNAAKSLGYKEAYDAIKEQTVRSELDEKENEAEAFKVRCHQILKTKRRAKRE